MAIKREAKFTQLFRHWLKANTNKFGSSVAFELKQTTSNRIPFSDIQEHQINALLASRGRGGLLYKAPDDSRGIKPFDLFFLKNAAAFVVIRYPNCFTIIEVATFKAEQLLSKRRSLTSERAREISTVTVELKK